MVVVWLLGTYIWAWIKFAENVLVLGKNWSGSDSALVLGCLAPRERRRLGRPLLVTRSSAWLLASVEREKREFVR